MVKSAVIEGKRNRYAHSSNLTASFRCVLEKDTLCCFLLLGDLAINSNFWSYFQVKTKKLNKISQPDSKILASLKAGWVIA